MSEEQTWIRFTWNKTVLFQSFGQEWEPVSTGLFAAVKVAIEFDAVWVVLEFRISSLVLAGECRDHRRIQVAFACERHLQMVLGETLEQNPFLGGKVKHWT